MKRSEMNATQKYIYDLGVDSYAQGQNDALISLAEAFINAGMYEQAKMTMEFLNVLEKSFKDKVAERNA